MFKTHCYVDWKLSCDILVMHLKEFQFQVEVFGFQKIWIKLLLLIQFSSKLQKYYFEESWHNLPFVERLPISLVWSKKLILNMAISKGQLFSKGLFKVLICTKNERKYFCIYALASKKKSNQKSSVRESK